MKIAICEDDNKMISEFGVTHYFYIYDNKTNKHEIVDTKGIAYGALAVMLDMKNVKQVICASISQGSCSALHSNGIEIVINSGHRQNILNELKTH